MEEKIVYEGKERLESKTTVINYYYRDNRDKVKQRRLSCS